MERDFVLNGIHVGEHAFEPEKIIDELNERCVKPGYSFVSIRPRGDGAFSQDYYVQWAKFLAENKIYFAFNYMAQHAPKGRENRFDPETVEKICQVAGEYFIGDSLGEPGSSAACKLQGYFVEADMKERHRDFELVKTQRRDMQDAHDTYVRHVSRFAEIDKRYGMTDVLSIEATILNKYNMEAGVTIPLIELLCGNPDIIVSSVRGTARAYDSRMWGTFAAHEWYGGMRHEDMLKRKRLELAYKYAYMAGSNILLIESGDTGIHSYGYDYDAEHELCGDYRRVLTEMNEYIKRDARPKGGPKTKVAFVSGLHDAWGGWGGSAVWNQFEREEWGHGEAEHSWRLLDELGVKRTWNEVMNYGDMDTSALPAYGMYDIVPIEADAEKLQRYDYLIFLGWNSMTEENMDKLIAYVEHGGHLLMNAAHLNTRVTREGGFEPVSAEKIEKLFGCRFSGETVRTNGGVKFGTESLNPNVLYPGTRSFVCDPLYSAGYVNYAKTELTGGYQAAFVSDSFRKTESDLPAVIENCLGKGVATLITSINYPGHPAHYPLYRAVARELISASARSCDIKVIGSDRVRWSVYEGDKVYLLNTDYDMPVIVKLIKGEHEQVVTLDALELRAVEV